ncbi:MAG: methionine gamma-lyase family protein, partial [Clostridiales bacterium]|nr:methionine gamma-lyase family protein [Clostridiales bacterium]
MIAKQEARLNKHFREIDEIALFNQEKVLNAFREEQIALRHFNGSTGYGYGDEGREKLGKVYARAFGAEAAVVSPAILSGTHALTVALFGVLRPNDKVLCISGMPYDTIRSVIWGEGNGSLADFGISCEVVPLTENGKVDFAAVEGALKQCSYKMVYIQRSRGYELRDAFTVDEIGAMCEFVRKKGFEDCIFVD